MTAEPGPWVDRLRRLLRGDAELPPIATLIGFAPTSIEPGAVVQRSIIRGPAIIGRDAKILHAYVGPFTSIMNGVEIQDTEIEHSIVLEGSCLRDLANRVTDSLIGKNVRIYRVPLKPSAYRFTLGDNSEVGIRW